MRDAADPDIAGDYDLVMAIEMLHDVPDPVGILRTMKRLAGAKGTVLVVDERTEERFSVPASEMERLFYSFSTLHCLAVKSMQDGGAGTGTVSDPTRSAATRGGRFLDVESSTWSIRSSFSIAWREPELISLRRQSSRCRRPSNDPYLPGCNAGPDQSGQDALCGASG